MVKFNANDYNLFKKLVSLNQKSLFDIMTSYLRKHYLHVQSYKHSVVAFGDIPVALVAHLDTVFYTPASEIFYDQQQNVVWSPDGLGADDRAGVFAIIKLIKAGYKPHIILTTDEEQGAIGAKNLVQDYINPPFASLKYIIQLDRHGKNDCVFYNCANDLFTMFIEQYGFIEATGSFSDISIICPAWKIAGVNLSVGYVDEHSYSERLYVSALYSTIEKVKKMLDEAHTIEEPFSYIPAKYPNQFMSIQDTEVLLNGEIKCSNCHNIFSDYEMFPVKGLDKKTKFMCPECVIKKAQWCEYCGEAFEINKKTSNEILCYDCRGKKK